MYLVSLVVLCICAVTCASDVVPVLLAQPLPAMDTFASSGLESVNTYHIPVGVAEAARIAHQESLVQEDGKESEKPNVMIVGGLASFRGEHKFMAGLVITLTTGETSVCGASLVSSRKLLTAASCYWDGLNQAYSMLAVLGSVYLFSGGNRVYASLVTVHPFYTPADVSHNIALLDIPYQSTTSYVKPIVMASGSNQYVGYRAEAIGFGRTSDTAPITTSASMRDVFVYVISNAACASYYGDYYATSNIICSDGAGGRNPCGGDQGGPLILYSSAGDDVLLGVFTFGSASGCSAGHPSGYMRVSYYYTWIYNNL